MRVPQSSGSAGAAGFCEGSRQIREGSGQFREGFGVVWGEVCLLPHVVGDIT